MRTRRFKFRNVSLRDWKIRQIFSHLSKSKTTIKIKLDLAKTYYNRFCLVFKHALQHQPVAQVNLFFASVHELPVMNSSVASPKIGGAKMFDFRRITLFCLEKRLSKHKMTMFSKNVGGEWPLWPPLATPMVMNRGA